MKKFGNIIIPYGVDPKQHELETAKVFTKLGKDIAFIAPVYIKSVKTPDIKMDGLSWEIKAPEGSSSRTVENNLRAALRQSTNIIFDLRRMKLNEQKAIAQIKKEFKLRRNINRIIVITNNQRLLDIKR